MLSLIDSKNEMNEVPQAASLYWATLNRVSFRPSPENQHRSRQSQDECLITIPYNQDDVMFGPLTYTLICIAVSSSL